MTARLVQVQRITAEEWRLFRRLRRAALAEAPAAFGSTLADWSATGDTEDRWRARLTSVPLNLVVTLDGCPVAMVSATAPGADGSIELISLWVDPAARGRGAGDAAVRAVIEAARTRPVVLSVKRDNTPARRLYERHGFALIGPSPDEPDEVLLRRQPG